MPEVTNKARIFIHSHFVADPFGHGGNKRTSQIKGILQLSNIDITEVQLDFDNSFLGKFRSLLKGWHYTKYDTSNLKKCYAIGRYIDAFDRFIECKQPSLIIWESTVELFLLFAEILRQHQIPFIALPHNIESVLPQSKSAITGNTGNRWFNEELSYLNVANEVFTISSEEKKLLEDNNVHAKYLPYYPCYEAESFLLNIRKERKDSHSTKQQKRILLLGTFYNTPTANGYEELLTKITYISHFSINVAGFGSEELQSKYSDSNIVFWGSVDKNLLAKLLTEADVAIVHQQHAAGALTRIPELLLAGVPILANHIAARSTGHLEGITVYQNFDELLSLINTTTFYNPPKPQRPKEEQLFLNIVRSNIK